ncbi:MAG: Clp protease N-terminal domain-containing protein [Thermoleophilia bacterium]
MRFPNPVREIRTIDRLLKGSEAQARRMGDEIPGAEHLLLSALELPDGTARAAFTAVGADPDALLPAVAEAHAEALRAVGIAVDAASLGDPGPLEPVTSGPTRSDPSQQAAFQEAVRLSKLERPAELRGAHVVIAVAGMEHGTAPRALAAMGVDRDALVAAARAALASG